MQTVVQCNNAGDKVFNRTKLNTVLTVVHEGIKPVVDAGVLLEVKPLIAVAEVKCCMAVRLHVGLHV